jgi:hypothetical protein
MPEPQVTDSLRVAAPEVPRTVLVWLQDRPRRMSKRAVPSNVVRHMHCTAAEPRTSYSMAVEAVGVGTHRDSLRAILLGLSGQCSRGDSTPLRLLPERRRIAHEVPSGRVLAHPALSRRSWRWSGGSIRCPDTTLGFSSRCRDSSRRTRTGSEFSGLSRVVLARPRGESGATTHNTSVERTDTAKSAVPPIWTPRVKPRRFAGRAGGR